MSEVVSLIAEIGALLAGGGLAGALFYRERKRGEQLKNETTASEQWRALFERSDADVRQRDSKIDKLYNEIAHLRTENNHLSTEVAVLTVHKCEVKGCAKRQPPSGY